jgi:TPR repeat protein
MDCQGAVHYFELSTDQGNVDRQWDWIMQLLTSDAIPRNLTNAIRYLRFSAENGSGRGQVIVGWMAEHGIGTPAYLIAAVRCYAFGCKKSRHACVLFGRGYETRRGVRVDFTLAAKCFQNAACSADVTVPQLFNYSAPPGRCLS